MAASAPQRLINGLTDLGIEKMQEHLAHYSELVNKGEKSFSEALEELVEIEKKNKQVRRDAINLHIANFPFIKTFDDFDFDFQPNLNKKELLELNSLAFVENKENIVFIGSSGVGKTHLAMAFGRECCLKGMKAYFLKATELNQRFSDARKYGRESSVINGLVKPSCLIIDEVGRCVFDKENTRMFFDVIDRRYNK